jgi:DNA-binding helix-hairpin-helix protein with protein kinase domain
VPEFTPPELQGKRLDQITRTSNHDSFGIAVLVFNLLFMGRHPFAGKYLGRDDMPMDKAIAQFRFAYSSRVKETRMVPPPNIPLLADIPQDLANAFEMAFGPSGVNVSRPKLSDWVELLERAKGTIVPCKSNPAHQYFRVAKSCPWCAMESAYPGFLAFAPPFSTNLSTPIDVGQLLAGINTVPDPGISKPLGTLMPVFGGSPSPMPPMGMGNWKTRYFGGLVAALWSLEMFYLDFPGPLAGAAALGGSVWLSFKQWDVAEPFRRKEAQVSKTFESLEARWMQIADNRSFLEIKRDASECVKRFNNLAPQETSRISDLKTRLRDRQLNLFLERYYIDHATIKGIGSARKLTLRSYGVETAADVSSQRVGNIPGFGSAMTGVILAWRISLERRFVFDPNQPINPADVAAIKTEFAKKRLELHADLKNWFAKLHATSLHIAQSREQIRIAAVPVWNALKRIAPARAALRGAMEDEDIGV